MHALLQQFQDIHQSHDLDHCEGRFYEGAKKVIANARDKAAAAAHSASAVAKGAMDAHKKHKAEVESAKNNERVAEAAAGAAATPKNCDEIWQQLSEDQKMVVFKNTLHDMQVSIPYEELKQILERNPKTKKLFQANMVPKPLLKL